MRLVYNRKFLQQLRILSRRLNLQPLITSIMQNISKYIDVETDVLFLKGREEGIEEEHDRQLKVIVKNLLVQGILSPQQIAQTADTSIEFVLKMQKELNDGKRKK